MTLLLIAIALPACAPPEKDPGLAAYEQLVAAVRRGDPQRLHAVLSPESQAWLAKSVGLPPDATGEQVAEVLGVRPGWQFELELPQRAKVIEPKAPESRTVEGPLAGRTWRIPTLKVDGTWRVHLAGASPVE